MHEPASISRRAAAALPLAAFFGPAAAAVSAPAATVSDPVLERIAEHRELRLALSRTSGLDDDPAYENACEVEEAALQALGDAQPMTVAGAAALLAYMADIEADFADDQSPLLRTVVTVARRLTELSRTASA